MRPLSMAVEKGVYAIIKHCEYSLTGDCGESRPEIGKCGTSCPQQAFEEATLVTGDLQ